MLHPHDIKTLQEKREYIEMIKEMYPESKDLVKVLSDLLFIKCLPLKTVMK